MYQLCKSSVKMRKEKEVSKAAIQDQSAHQIARSNQSPDQTNRQIKSIARSNQSAEKRMSNRLFFFFGGGGGDGASPLIHHGSPLLPCLPLKGQDSTHLYSTIFLRPPASWRQLHSYCTVSLITNLWGNHSSS